MRGRVHAQAYSADGLGVLTVSGVPGFPELRSRLLTLASSFAVGGAGPTQCDRSPRPATLSVAQI